jgi:hypothetical protein
MAVGLPTCHCGGRILPTSPADLAFAGVIGAEDMRPAQWTVICRENGWEDAIQRKGNAAKQFADRRRLEELAGGRALPKPQCAYPGCGKWTASGAEFCSTHNPAGIAEDACPF